MTTSTERKRKSTSTATTTSDGCVSLSKRKGSMDTSSEDGGSSAAAAADGSSSLDILSRAANEDTELVDVVLVGNDHVKVPAVKFVLAAHSKVFKKMFYGPFKESKDSTTTNVLEVPLECSGRTLQTIYTLCSTKDPIPPVALDDDDDDGEEEEPQNNKTLLMTNNGQELVELVHAAHYFEFQPLIENAAIRLAESIFATDPSIACEVYNLTSYDTCTKKLYSLALKTIRGDPEASLLPETTQETTPSARRGATCLLPEKLSELLSDDKLAVKEIFMFQVLEKWAHHRPEDDEEQNNRLAIAQELVQKIDFAYIKSSDLVDIVLEAAATTMDNTDEQHRLINQKDIYEILAQNAIKAEEEGYCISEYRSEQRKKMAIEKSTTITVKNAGREDVNGVYVKDGMFHGNPKFIKKSTLGSSSTHSSRKSGKWGGRKKSTTVTPKFYIVLCENKWFICITTNSNHSLEEGTEIDLYMCPSNNFSARNRHWICCEQGIDPPPIVEYVAP